MSLVYHPAVQRDVSAILRHYDRISTGLGEEFWGELTAAIEAVRDSPERYRFAVGSPRRINLQRFPYQIL